MIADSILDAGLNVIKNNTETLYLCNAEPTTYLEASSTYKVGSKASPAFTGPADGDPDGRVLTVDAITDGVLSGTGWVYYYALAKDSTQELLLVRPLPVAREIVTELTFTSPAFSFRFPDPA